MSSLIHQKLCAARDAIKCGLIIDPLAKHFDNKHLAKLFIVCLATNDGIDISTIQWAAH
jgi:hypothetical protein